MNDVSQLKASVKEIGIHSVEECNICLTLRNNGLLNDGYKKDDDGIIDRRKFNPKRMNTPTKQCLKEGLFTQEEIQVEFKGKMVDRYKITITPYGIEEVRKMLLSLGYRQRQSQ